VCESGRQEPDATAREEAARRNKREQWLVENADAIDRYNADVDSRGVFSDGLRRF
jgi:post-segregation antitoxin (ccd killing protein)